MKQYNQKTIRVSKQKQILSDLCLSRFLFACPLSLEGNMSECKPIKGYEGKYFIYADGRVWSNYRKPKFLKLQIKRRGYLGVSLHKGKKLVNKRINRLVAEAFIPNPLNKPYTNHKDGNPKNNNVSNIEWCTQKENVNHSINILNRWSNSGKQRKAASKQGRLNRRFTMAKARIIRKEYKVGGISIRKLSTQYGLSKSCMERLLYNKSYKENNNAIN